MTLQNVSLLLADVTAFGTWLTGTHDYEKLGITTIGDRLMSECQCLP